MSRLIKMFIIIIALLFSAYCISYAGPPLVLHKSITAGTNIELAAQTARSYLQEDYDMTLEGWLRATFPNATDEEINSALKAAQR